MAQIAAHKYLSTRLFLGVAIAVIAFMMQSAPEKSLAEHDVVYTVSELEELAMNTPSS